MYLPETYTLHVETRDDVDGIWLCLDNGMEAIPIARFESAEAAAMYTRAAAVAFAKGHAMGKFGI
jgi:hypothetical protein